MSKPVEVLRVVCRRLPLDNVSCGSRYEDESSTLATLLSIARLSRSCHEAAEPKLYQTLDLRRFGSERLQKLIASICADQRRARWPQKLCLSDWATQYDAAFSGDQPNPVEAAIMNKASSLRTSLVLRKRILEGLRNGWEDALVAVLLCICPNFQIIVFAAPYQYQQTLVAEAVAEAVWHVNNPGDSYANPPLQCLVEAQVQHWNAEDTMNLSRLANFLHLPTMRRFRGALLECNGSLSASSIHSHLFSFELSDSVIDAAGLRELLAACPYLKELRLGWASTSVGPSFFGWPEIGDVLRKHGHSLCMLSMQLHEDCVFAGEDDAETGQLGDLTALKALRFLEAPFGSLLAREPTLTHGPFVNILPHSLEELRILDVEQADRDARPLHIHLASLLNAASLVNLRSVSLSQPLSPLTADLDSAWATQSRDGWFWLEKRTRFGKVAK